MWLGIDLGSSSVKVSLLDESGGQVLARTTVPELGEMGMTRPKPGWAEQSPELWWDLTCQGIRQVMEGRDASNLRGIGIAYQMHGLVCMGANDEVLRPAILWCDSRAVEIGERYFGEIGRDKCLAHLHQSPGNFTVSKLAWVRENEPDVYAKIDKVGLPGDYLAYRLSGEWQTTDGGLSEAAAWDFSKGEMANFLMGGMGLKASLWPNRVPILGLQCEVSRAAAAELGIPAGVPISYRAGDQPNNAFALGANAPGDVAASGGTSGVLYGVSEAPLADAQQRVNPFLHVTHRQDQPRIGVLMCLNGAGSQMAWLRRITGVDYDQLNEQASSVSPGADGLTCLPFGMGAERILGNRTVGMQWRGGDFGKHGVGELSRACFEGIALAFRYGAEAMAAAGVEIRSVRAASSGLFLSPVFAQALADLLQAPIDCIAANGADGAARAAALGAGHYGSVTEASAVLKVKRSYVPQSNTEYAEVYDRWRDLLLSNLK